MNFCLFLRVFFSLLLLILLIRITYSDIQCMQIPDSLNLRFLILSLGISFLFPDVSIVSRFLGFLCVSVPLLILAYFFPGSFGGGDIKLMAVAGVLLGWHDACAAFVYSVYICGFYILLSRLTTLALSRKQIYFFTKSKLLISRTSKESTHIPFGPFLALGIAAAFFL